jgi:hypothetical protein
MSAPRIGALAFSLASALSIGTVGPTVAQHSAALIDTCFSRTYDAAHLARHPAQRVAAISVAFQTFEDSLLAGVMYKLRFGPTFSFSGDCYTAIEGGFLCQACGTTDSCQGSGESFKILWSGGDEVQLVNDTSGLFAENAEGGRDRLAPGGEHRLFALKRAPAEECAW